VLRLSRLLSALAAASLVVAAARPASAHVAGIDGHSGKNAGILCNECHNGGTKPTLTLTGPDKLAAGQVADYVLRVETDAALVGMAAAATDGVKLTPSTNTKTLNAEVVHAGGTVPVAGAAEFTFKVTAPATPGAITLWVAGNATNASDSPDGDLADGTTKIVTIEAAPAGALPDGGAGDLDGGSATGTGVSAANPTAADGGAKPFSAGSDEPFDPTFAQTGLSCSVGGAPSPLEPGTLAIIGLALLAAGARWGRGRPDRAGDP
jgi:hypothetical protein